MNNVKKVKIDHDIELNESEIKEMPDDIKGRLLVTMTMAAKKFKCHWKDLCWRVDKNRVIYVDKK